MWMIAGHTRAINILQRAVDSQQVPHALLLTGPTGIGKTRLALELAKAMNCTGEQRPDQVCMDCLQIEHGSHPDVTVIERLDGKTGILIEQIRALRDTASMRPFQGRMKVFVLAGAEALTAQAADALLKTLEEPQKQVTVILTAVDSGAVPATVISRCRVMPLQAVDRGSLVQALTDEGCGVDEAERLARLAHGNVGWAKHAARDPKLADQQEEMIDGLVGVFDLRLDDRLSLADSLTAGKRDRSAVRKIMEALVLLGRDLLLVTYGLPAQATTADQQTTLARQAQRLSGEQIHRYLQRLKLAMDRIDSNVDPRLTLEALLMELP